MARSSLACRTAVRVSDGAVTTIRHFDRTCFQDYAKLQLCGNSQSPGRARNTAEEVWVFGWRCLHNVSGCQHHLDRLDAVVKVTVPKETTLTSTPGIANSAVIPGKFHGHRRKQAVARVVWTSLSIGHRDNGLNYKCLRGHIGAEHVVTHAKSLSFCCYELVECCLSSSG